MPCSPTSSTCPTTPRSGWAPKSSARSGAISTSNFQADLTLDIKTSVRLPVGTTAQVRFDDPLGDEYILLQGPRSPPTATADDSSRFLAPGAAHPRELDTSTAPSVEDTFGALSLVLNGGGINQLQTIIGELNDTFNGNQTADPLVPHHHRRRGQLPRRRTAGHRQRPGLHLRT